MLVAAKLLFGAAVDENVRRQAKLPAGRRGCVECHTLKPSAGPIVNPSSLATLEIEPPLMTPVWQETRSSITGPIALGLCSSATPGQYVKQNGDTALLPGISQCVACHAPAGGRERLSRAERARACTECHRYHNGDHPEQGLGASARRGEVEQTPRAISWRKAWKWIGSDVSIGRSRRIAGDLGARPATIGRHSCFGSASVN